LSAVRALSPTVPESMPDAAMYSFFAVCAYCERMQHRGNHLLPCDNNTIAFLHRLSSNREDRYLVAWACANVVEVSLAIEKVRVIVFRQIEEEWKVLSIRFPAL
jgi:hypothetical protein